LFPKKHAARLVRARTELMPNLVSESSRTFRAAFTHLPDNSTFHSGLKQSFNASCTLKSTRSHAVAHSQAGVLKRPRVTFVPATTAKEILPVMERKRQPGLKRFPKVNSQPRWLPFFALYAPAQQQRHSY
jgi:hypothetical protein